MIQNVDQFQEVFEAMTNNIIANTERVVMLETALGEKVYPELTSIKNVMQEVDKNLANMLDFDKEMARDEARRRGQERVNNRPTTPKEGPNVPPAPNVEEESKGFFSDLFDSISGISLSRILTAAFIAPFVYKFAEGFIEQITDGIIDLTVAGVTGVSALIQGKLNSAFKLLGDAFTKLGKPIRFLVTTTQTIGNVFGKIGTAITKVGDGVKTFLGKLKPVGNFVSRVFGALPGAGTLKLLLGRLAWPITIVMGMIEAVQEYINTDGPRFEKFKAAVGGFFGEIVGAPLDLLKDMSAWVLKKFGFDEQSEALQGFSFTEQIKKIVGGAFDVVKGVVDWVKTLFTDPTEALNTLWQTALGTYKSFLDIIFYPIDKAVSWVSGLFGWTPGEDFSLSDTVLGAAKKAGEWVSEKFTWSTENFPEIDILGTFTSWIEDLETWVMGILPDLPSVDDISNAFFNSLPNWMQKAINKDLGSADTDPAEVQAIIAELNAERAALQSELEGLTSKGDRNKKVAVQNRINEIESALESYSTGTKGFNDFGKGTLAMLHNKEAVVPLETPAGRFLDMFFDENWKPRLEQFTSSAVPVTTTNAIPMLKQKFVSDSAEQRAMEQSNAQRAIMNIAPNVMSSRPVTNNNSNTTIINNVSPARTLDDPSMLK